MSFYDEVICQCEWFATPERMASIELLEPGTRRRVMQIVADARGSGISFVAFETYRSRQRQQFLYARGVTQLQTVGTHHYGVACDLVRVVDGNPTWEGDYTLLGRLAAKHGLIWGGDWGRPGVVPQLFDGVHVQRCAVSRQAALFEGTWYPDDDYDPYADSI